MAKNINVSGALIPTTINTPLDARSVVETIEDLENISYPNIGLQVYIKSENRYIRVTALGPKRIGPLIVTMAAIESWEYDDTKVVELEGRVKRIEDALGGDTLSNLEEVAERAQKAAESIEQLTENTIDSDDISILFPEEGKD